VALYIGQTDSFRDRIPGHERWDEARRAGATHVHAMVVTNSSERDRIEAELIRHYQPKMNELLKKFFRG
jgi:predicted GIY-YIG superfamily endonuclease